MKNFIIGFVLIENLLKFVAEKTIHTSQRTDAQTKASKR